MKTEIRIDKNDDGSDTYSVHIPTLRGMDSIFMNGDRVISVNQVKLFAQNAQSKLIDRDTNFGMNESYRTSIGDLLAFLDSNEK